MKYFLVVLGGILAYSASTFSMESSSPCTHPEKGDYRFLHDKLVEASKAGAALIEAIPAGPRRGPLRTLTQAVQRGSRFSNVSMAQYNGGYFIAARISYLVDNAPSSDTTIIPGNRPESKFEKGHNFWWMDWGSNKFSGGTLYFLANADFSSVELMVPAETNGTWYMARDTRIASFDDQLYAFNPKDEEIIASVTILNHRQHGPRYLRFSGEYNTNMPGNNFGLLEIADKKALYIDWFYEKGLKICALNCGNPFNKERFLPFHEGFAFDGEGSCSTDEREHRHRGVLPLLSFGTPHLIVGDMYVGIGHAKILVDNEAYPYEIGSPIQKFCEGIDRQLKPKFGDKLIRHDAYSSQSNENKGYHYLMYFYFIRKNLETGEWYGMRMSDSFLPIFKNNSSGDGYVFTLFFPMGITRAVDQPDMVHITGGYGDYHPLLLTLPQDWILSQCHHDVQEMNFRRYDYRYLVFEGEGKVRVASEPSEL